MFSWHTLTCRPTALDKVIDAYPEADHEDDTQDCVSRGQEREDKSCDADQNATKGERGALVEGAVE